MAEASFDTPIHEHDGHFVYRSGGACLRHAGASCLLDLATALKVGQIDLPCLPSAAILKEEFHGLKTALLVEGYMVWISPPMRLFHHRYRTMKMTSTAQ